MIYFLGCSRTASKAYMYFLNHHSEVNVTRELHLHKCLGKGNLYDELKRFNGNGDVKRFTERLANLKHASYWRSNDYDPASFEAFISDKIIKKLSYWDLVKHILDFDRHQKKKKIVGAKFPIHIAFYPLFRRKIKEGKFVFLARNPEHILFSQFNKHQLKSAATRMIMVLYTAIMFNFTICYGLIYSPKRAIFIKYEEFNQNKDQVLKRLCDFLNVPFRKNLLEIPVLDSRIKRDSREFQVKKRELIMLKLLTFPFLSIYNAHR